MKRNFFLALMCVLSIQYETLSAQDTKAPYFTNLITHRATFNPVKPNQRLLNNWFTLDGPLIINKEENYFTRGKTARNNGVDIRQVIHLKGKGFSDKLMDKEPPIFISQNYTYSGKNIASLKVELWDKNRKRIHIWNSEDITLNSNSNTVESKQLVKKITNYGKGVRYIRVMVILNGEPDKKGPRAGDTFLTIQPENLLDNPGSESSWDWQGTDVDKSGNKTYQYISNNNTPNHDPEFRTRGKNWVRRQQTIDLISQGFSANELNAGKTPITVSSVYGKTNCPGFYFLKVELLDRNHNVIEVYDTGVKKHNVDCSIEDYSEVVTKTFYDYGRNVRYIRWTEGGRSSDNNNNFNGTVFSQPYVGLVHHNSNDHHRVRRDLSSFLSDWFPTILTGVIAGAFAIAACVGSVGIACSAAVAGAAIAVTTVATANSRVIQKPITLTEQSSFLDNNITSDNCDQDCNLNKIKASLDANQFGRMWQITNNSNTELYATPNSNGDIKSTGFQNKVLNTIESAEHFIDITTLARIDDDWLSLMSESLAKVANEAKAKGTKPVVRIYIGLDGLLTGWTDFLFNVFQRRVTNLADVGIPENSWNTHLAGIMSKLTAKIDPGGDMEIYIAGSRISQGVIPVRNVTWNHSKIVAVDGKQSLTGGHNLWDQYLLERPIFDSSIWVEGDATKSAHLYADEVWKEHRKAYGNNHIVKWTQNNNGTTHLGLFDASTGKETSIPKAHERLELTATSDGDIKILAIGQLGKSDGPSQIKKAITAMVNTAEESIFMSQQALTHQFVDKIESFTGYDYFEWGLQSLDKDLATALVRKAINGVSVRIVLSNDAAPYETTSHTGNEYLLDMIWSAAISRGVSDTRSNRNKLCANLKLGNIRIDKNFETFPGSDKQFPNHTKQIMIDKSMFLIGSHNLYTQDPAQLYEYVNIIGDNGTSSTNYNAYWKPLIENAERTFISTSDCVSILDTKFLEAEKVVIFSNSNFGGASQDLLPGDYNASQLGAVGSSRISSITVPLGWRVKLYVNSNFRGTPLVLEHDTRWIGKAYNDLVVNVKVEIIDNYTIPSVDTSKKVTIYENTNFKGNSQELHEGLYNSVDLVIGDNQLSSIKVPEGWIVTLYTEKNYSGYIKIITGNTSNMPTEMYEHIQGNGKTVDFNDNVSSIYVREIVTDVIGVLESDEPRRKSADIDLTNNDFNILMFPNPTKGKVQLKLSEDLYTRIRGVYISNILGKAERINIDNEYNKILDIDLSTKASGIYYITIYTDKGDKITKKIIKI